MLFKRRKWLRELADAEEAGRSLWTDKLDAQARYKLAYNVRYLAGDLIGRYSLDLVGYARNLAMEDLGLPFLHDSVSPKDDAFGVILNASEEIVLSFLEARLKAANQFAHEYTESITASEAGGLEARLPLFVGRIRTVLQEHHLSFDLVGDEFVPFESRQMHEAVVVPTLTLLGGAKGFDEVERAYRAALEELQTGFPEDAITDAGTALQEALKAVGCEGNALGPLGNSARERGILSAHDAKLLAWVSADRSTTGDAHNARPASPEDAWLAVHVVGAMILRMASGRPRSA